MLASQGYRLPPETQCSRCKVRRTPPWRHVRTFLPGTTRDLFCSLMFRRDPADQRLSVTLAACNGLVDCDGSLLSSDILLDACELFTVNTRPRLLEAILYSRCVSRAFSLRILRLTSSLLLAISFCIVCTMYASRMMMC